MSTVRSTALTLPLFRVGQPARRTIPLRPRYLRLSPELAALRSPKVQVTNLTENERFSFEQGGQVLKDFPMPGIYFYLQLPSGAQTVNGTRSDRAMFDKYQSWRSAEGIRDLSREEVLSHLRSVADRLERLGLKLDNRNGIGGPNKLTGLIENGEAWQIIDEVLSILPDRFLKNRDLRAIRVGTARVGAALASAYDEHAVHIYHGAMQGSRRELIAKIVHELGHSTEKSLDPLTLAKLKAAHQEIRHDLIGLDILGGPEYRLGYQQSFSEFLAEMHLIYVCAGPLLRGKIDSYPAGSKEREAWEFVYNTLRDQVFDGREYA